MLVSWYRVIRVVFVASLPPSHELVYISTDILSRSVEGNIRFHASAATPLGPRMPSRRHPLGFWPGDSLFLTQKQMEKIVNSTESHGQASFRWPCTTNLRSLGAVRRFLRRRSEPEVLPGSALTAQRRNFGAPAKQETSPDNLLWLRLAAIRLRDRPLGPTATTLRHRPSETIPDSLNGPADQTGSMGSVCARRNSSHSARVNTPVVVPTARTQLAPRALATRRHPSASSPCSIP